MVHILDTLTRLENKFDNLALSSGAGTPETSGSGPRASVSHSSTSSNRVPRADEYLSGQIPLELQQGHHHLTVPHKIILWPSIYIHLINSGISAASDLQFVLQEGTPWFIRQEMLNQKEPLAPEVGLSSFTMSGRSPGQGQPDRIGFTNLTVQKMQEYCDSYFTTFNVLAPVLNREMFMTQTMTAILQDGFGDGDENSVLALLVLALGQLAFEGVFRDPVSMVNGTSSGFRGGTIDKPPGIEIFNEARRRLGFVVTQNSLENVQIMLLQATYYESTARHLDFWRSTVNASMACQVLIRCQSIDWQSHYGDLVKRAYWTCVLSEDLYHLDLDLPQSGIQQLEDSVPLPYFHEGQDRFQTDEERSHFQYHFLAMIALRRLISRIHEVIHECESTDLSN